MAKRKAHKKVAQGRHRGRIPVPYGEIDPSTSSCMWLVSDSLINIEEDGNIGWWSDTDYTECLFEDMSSLARNYCCKSGPCREYCDWLYSQSPPPFGEIGGCVRGDFHWHDQANMVGACYCDCGIAGGVVPQGTR